MTQTPVRAPARRPVRFAAADIGGALTRGAVAGIVAGWAFLLANMWFAYSQGLPAGAPLAVIATVFYAAPAPTLTAASMLVGAVTHVALSLGFGMGFAVLLLAVPALRRTPLLVLAGLGYGSRCGSLTSRSSAAPSSPSSPTPWAPTSCSKDSSTPSSSGWAWCRSSSAGRQALRS
jgi:hypothetical protein